MYHVAINQISRYCCNRTIRWYFPLVFINECLFVFCPEININERKMNIIYTGVFKRYLILGIVLTFFPFDNSYSSNSIPPKTSYLDRDGKPNHRTVNPLSRKKVRRKHSARQPFPSGIAPNQYVIYRLRFAYFRGGHNAFSDCTGNWVKNRLKGKYHESRQLSVFAHRLNYRLHIQVIILLGQF